MAREGSAIDDDCQSIDWPQQKSGDSDRYNGPRHGDWHTTTTESYVDDRCETVLGYSLYTSSTRNESHTIDGALLMKLVKTTAQQKRSMLNRNNQERTLESTRGEGEKTSIEVDKARRFIVPKLEKKAVSKPKSVHRNDPDQRRTDSAKRRDDLETEKDVSELAKPYIVSISSNVEADLADCVTEPSKDSPSAVHPADLGGSTTTNQKNGYSPRGSPIGKKSRKQQRIRPNHVKREPKQIEAFTIPADEFNEVESVTIDMQSEASETIRAGHTPDVDAVDLPLAAPASANSSPQMQKSKRSKLTTIMNHKLSSPPPILLPIPSLSTKKSAAANGPRSIVSTRTPRGSSKWSIRTVSIGGKDPHIEASLTYTPSHRTQVLLGHGSPLRLRSSKEWQEQEMLGKDVIVPSLVQHSFLEKLEPAELHNSSASKHVVPLHIQSSIETLGASHIAEQSLPSAINKNAQADRDLHRPQSQTRQRSEIRQTVLSVGTHSSARSSPQGGSSGPSQRIHPYQKSHIPSASGDSHAAWNTDSLKNAFQPSRLSGHASSYALSASHAQSDSTRRSTTSTGLSVPRPRSLSRSFNSHWPDLRTVYAGRGWISPHPCSTLGSQVEAKIHMSATSNLSSHVLSYSEWNLMRDTLDDKDTLVSSSKDSRVISQDSIASSCEQLQDLDKEHSRLDFTFSVCETLSGEDTRSISREPNGVACPTRYQSYAGYVGSTFWLSDGILLVDILGFQILPQLSLFPLPVLCSQSATSNGLPCYATQPSKFSSFWFSGIRYAKFPGRFKYSSVLQGDGSNVNALRYGSSGKQPGSGSEDWFPLNIETPYLSKQNLRPVLFWIHGGGFTGGGGAGYGGQSASREDVVTVTINYRLGTYGFLAVPGQLNGSFGLADQATALHWVVDNIANFGGDPDQIAIAGQSAGAGSVRVLLGSPVSIGKFQGAIAMSNLGFDTSLGLGSGYGTTYSSYLTIAGSYAIAGQNIFAAAGCNQNTVAAQVNCLEAYSDDLTAFSAVARYPVQDGTYINTPQLLVGARSANVAHVPVIFGIATDDGGSFCADSKTCTTESSCPMSNLYISSANAQDVISSGLFPLPDGPIAAAAFNTSARIETDLTFRCIDSATMYAGSATDAFKSAYYYESERGYPEDTNGPNNVNNEGTVSAAFPHGDPSTPYYKRSVRELHQKWTAKPIDAVFESAPVLDILGSYTVRGQLIACVF